VSSAATTVGQEAIAEVRSFLSQGTHFFAGNQAVVAFENTSHFLTTGGLTFAPQPTSFDVYNPASLVAQLDGAFRSVGGSNPSFALPAGSAYKAAGIVTIVAHGMAPGVQDVWMAGFLDGSCPPNAGTCGSLGKVSYLGGHQYATNTPISTNPSTQGVRLFLNSIFEWQCASQAGVK
jgi:hypothetical protein